MVSGADRLDLEALLTSWTRSLRARNRSPRTIQTYTESARKLAAFAVEHDLDPLSRRAIETYLADQADRWKPATVAFRYRSLQQFFGWLVDEDELEHDPMARMKPPAVPEQPVPVLSTEQLRALLKAAEGKGFTERRDTAILRLFIDTGMRLGELTGLSLPDLDLDVDNVALVTGKGRRMRACPFGARTAQALDRYLRVRVRHPRSAEAALWLGARGKGPMSSSGLAQVLKRRSRDAGIGHVHLTNSVTPTPRSGSPPAEPRATSCVWRGGGHARCCSATAPRWPTSAPEATVETEHHLLLDEASAGRQDVPLARGPDSQWISLPCM